MTLVAVFAAAVYFVVPLAAPSPPDSPSPGESATFGEPWTIDSLTAAFRESGLAVEARTVMTTNDLDQYWPGSGLAIPGTFGGHSGVIVVYSSEVERGIFWRGQPNDDRVRSEVAFGIPELTAVGLDNAVIVFDTNQEPSTQGSPDLVSVVRALRHQ